MSVRPSPLLPVIGVGLLIASIWSFSKARGETDLPTDRATKHPNQSSVARPQFCGLETTDFGGDADWLCFVDEDGAPLLFPWNTLVSGYGAAVGRVCYSMTIDGADIAIAQASGVVTDSADGRADGKAQCVKTASGRPYALVLDPYQFNQTGAVLRRAGVCATAFDGGIESGANTGRPCGDTDECTGGDGGTDLCVGGAADGGQNQGTDQHAAGLTKGAYVCMTAGAVDDLCAE